jgi:conserved oligomeric Golgi complex subunit 7
MCQFLSLTYETIVASCTANDQLDDLQAVLPFTVSSYIEYQTKLSTCETKYFEEKGRALTKDIQAAAMSLSATEDQGGFVDVIQTASEQLQALATSTFPMAEGAVARMELLSGGYDAQSVLAVVDSQVSTVAKEVALSVHKLCLLDIEFDEAIVLASLSVLKIAGSFRKSLDTLESKTHQRCSLMRDRIVKYSPPKLTDFMMSAVEVDTFLTRKVCCKDLQTSVDSLQTLADSKFVFQKTREQCQRLAASCHEFVFHVCGSVPRLQLAKISLLGSWSSSAKVGDDAIDYGTLPQEYITHVGEHMLSLVQALEPFATDRDALELANHAMEGSKEVALGSWTDFCSSVNGQDKLVPRLIESKTFEGYVLGAHLEEEDEQETERDEDENKAVTVFCNAWLEAIGTAVTGRLLERIMRIPLLTTKGSDQLCADLQYLINVLTALGVSELPHPLLGHLAELSTLETDLLEQRIESMDRSDDISNFVCLVESRLLAMRQRH